MTNQWINEASMLDILKQYLVGKYIQVYPTQFGYSVIPQNNSPIKVKVKRLDRDFDGAVIEVMFDNYTLTAVNVTFSQKIQIIGS